MEITGENFIGTTRSARGKNTFRTFNPEMNSENPWLFVEASETEINEAVDKAWEAFPLYRNTTPEERALFLRTIADEIEALGETLIQTFSQESGLPEGRAKGERGRTVFQLRSFADLIEEDTWKRTSIDHAEPGRVPLSKLDLRQSCIPLGPVAVFGASNFPLAYSTAGGDTASALAAGCPVVVKSHPMHAGTGELVANAVVRAAQKTGMPDGVFSNLNSKGIEVGTQLVSHPKIKAVGFTGSIRGGRALYDLAAKRPEPIPVFAEMGSTNPVVVTQKALETKGAEWANTYADSITLGTGQFCTNPGLILGIQSPELDQFAQDVAAKINAADSTCMLHPNIRASYTELKNERIENPAITALTHVSGVKPNYAEQAFVRTTGKTYLEQPDLHMEVFGPFSMLVACESREELLAVITQLEGQLTGTIIAADDEVSSLSDLVDALQYRVGRLIFNGVPTGVEVCPSMNHGGPYPASTDSRFTAVGTNSIYRWVRLVSFQNFPPRLLPNELRHGEA